MKVFVLAFTILLQAIVYCSVPPDSVIATVGNKTITALEFRNRFELSPQVFKKEDILKKKEQFLYTLIAEKLFALASEKSDPDTSAIIKYTYDEVERMYMRDALWKLMITDKIAVTEDELKNAAAKEMYKLVLRPSVYDDSGTAWRDYKSLKSGAKFDSISSASAVPEMEIEFGNLREDIENEVYKLTPGQFTSPLKYGRGWYIFYLKEKKPAQDKSVDIMSIVKKADRRLREIKSTALYNEYYRKFFVGKSVNADGNIFWSIVSKIENTVKDKAPFDKEYKLTLNDIETVERLFGDSLSAVYINIDNYPLTIKEFLRKLYFQGFKVLERDAGNIAARLNASVKVIIENELLTAEAYKLNLSQLPEVKNELKTWKENYLSALFTAVVTDSVSRALENNKKNNDYRLTFIEIFTDELNDVETILNKIKEGEDFQKLTEKYNKRTSNTKNNGLYSQVPVSAVDEAIAKTVLSLNEGEVFGPIAVDNGYSIIKLLKKEKNDTTGLKNNTLVNETLEALKAKAVQLASEYGIRINYEMLNRVYVTENNMFTIRLMGFGGRIPAVPIISPFYEWFEQWQKNQKEVP